MTLWAAGDSITYGNGTRVASWPHRLGERLAGYLQADVAVVNKGRGGTGVLLTLGGQEPLKTWLPAQVAAAPTPPAVVVILDGVNDLVGLNTSDIGQLNQAVYALVGTLGAAGVHRVFVATITPFRAGSALPAGWIPTMTQRRTVYNSWIRAMYGPTGQLLDIGDTIAGPDGLLLPVFDSGDGLHPNDAAAAVLAGTIDVTRLVT